MNQVIATKAFIESDKAQGSIVTPADFYMVIPELSHLAFSLKSHGLPMLKTEKVEYRASGGIQMFDVGRVQTLNDVPLVFMERKGHLVKKTIEDYLMSNDRRNLTVHFFSGLSIEDTTLWGSMTGSAFFIEDNPEADTESTTTALTISATLTGHYEPPGGGVFKPTTYNLAQGLINNLL